MQKPIPISIDTTNDSPYYIDKNINQGDTLAFTIKVSQGSQSLSLVNQEVHIIVKRFNGYSVEMKTGNALLNVSNNVITAVFKDDYLCTDAEGIAIGEIKLIDSTGESSTNHFRFEVKKSLEKDIITKSANTLDTFIGIKNLIDSYNANADNLAIQNQLALQHEVNLSTLNTNADNLAERLEKDISDGIPLAERLEKDNADGLIIANRVELDISNANLAENKLQAATVNGNNVITQLQNVNWKTMQSWMDLMEFISMGMPFTDENNVEFTDENNIIFTM